MPARRAIDQSSPLTLENAVGNGQPATADIIKMQNAVLMSNATVLGAVNEFRVGIDGRLTRKFGEVTTQIGVLDTKIDGVQTQVGAIKSARDIEAAKAEQAAKDETRHAATAHDERQEQTAKIADHILSTRWRVGIVVVIGIPAFAQLWPIVMQAIRNVPR
jgi:outer membrane murein-binding lipoprotein Lpp